MSGARAAVRSVSGPLPEGEEKRQAVRQMFDSIAPRYDLLNKAMTFGLDLYWRRRTVALMELEAGSRVLDLACGTGDFVRLLAGEHRPVGLDFSAGMLKNARVAQAPLVRGDAAALPFEDNAFDALVSGFGLRNFADLPVAIGEMGRVLRPGGRLGLLEVAEPSSPLLKAGHGLWFNKVVPRLGRLTADPEAYGYLPRSVAYLPSAAELASRLERAGFPSPRRVALTGGVVQVLLGVKK